MQGFCTKASEIKAKQKTKKTKTDPLSNLRPPSPHQPQHTQHLVQCHTNLGSCQTSEKINVLYCLQAKQRTQSVMIKCLESLRKWPVKNNFQTVLHMHLVKWCPELRVFAWPYSEFTLWYTSLKLYKTKPKIKMLDTWLNLTTKWSWTAWIQLKSETIHTMKTKYWSTLY